MAETGKMKTYSDALDAMLSKSTMLSPDLFCQVETYVREHPETGYLNEREFIEDAIRSKLICLSKDEWFPPTGEKKH